MSETCPTIANGSPCGAPIEPGFVVCGEHATGPALLAAYRRTRARLAAVEAERDEAREYARDASKAIGDAVCEVAPASRYYANPAVDVLTIVAMVEQARAKAVGMAGDVLKLGWRFAAEKTAARAIIARWGGEADDGE